MLSLLADGPCRIRGLLDSEDVRATAKAVQALGAQLKPDGDDWVLTPPDEITEPVDVLDCGNSGTTIRLMLGILASAPIFSVVTGDGSLRRRPMARVTEPLRKMGAVIDGRCEADRAPLAIRGRTLKAVHHDLKVASAQVKSALLLAGLRGGVAVREPSRSRDHTERLLRRMGANLRYDTEGWLLLLPMDGNLRAVDHDVPGDLSSAAFPLVAGALVPDSEITVRGVGLNPTRSGVIDVLEAMGADLVVEPSANPDAGEPCGDVTVRGSRLVGTQIDGELAVRCLDELPVLAVAAACAEGETSIRGAEELRVKEADRITRVADGLRALGIEVEEHRDGMTISGGRLHGNTVVQAHDDHRLAMAFSVANLMVDGHVEVQGTESVATSYPHFFDDLAGLRA